MESTLTQEQQQSVQQIYNFAANLMVKEQRTAFDVREILIEKGLSEEVASHIVDTLQEQIADAKKKRAGKDALYGGLWFFGGILVTVLTYASASNGGGTYFVAWGAIIFGGIQFFRGIAGLAG